MPEPTLKLGRRLKQQAATYTRQISTLLIAYRDPRTPWYAKAFTALVVAYALSPIDLIPDFIPVLGYLDDIILLPLGIMLAIKMIPAEVFNESRSKAKLRIDRRLPHSKAGIGVVLLIWLIGTAAFGFIFTQFFTVT